MVVHRLLGKPVQSGNSLRIQQRVASERHPERRAAIPKTRGFEIRLAHRFEHGADPAAPVLDQMQILQIDGAIRSGIAGNGKVTMAFTRSWRRLMPASIPSR
ncbi:MAG TPA: hypothetical protein VIK21_09370 [Desulfuromonadaceae bacterium]